MKTTTITKDFKSIGSFMGTMILIWIVAFCLFEIFRLVGIDSNYYERTATLELGPVLLRALYVGTTIGVAYSLTEIWFDQQYFHKMSLGKLILVKNLIYFLVAKLIFFTVVFFYVYQAHETQEYAILLKGMSDSSFWIFLLYFLILSFLISLALQVRQQIGPGNLWKLITGEFHKPKEEERIFLFIDLKDSVDVAEKLGNILYSQLIQDCFFDLSEIITKYKISVYQYLGDQAVLSWNKDEGLKDSNCFNAYFDFKKKLESRSQYYNSTYGLIPSFKAGVHMGKVTVAEVGVVKKEIAYHGVVLKTTSLIQDQCDNNDQELLASQELIENIGGHKGFKSMLMDNKILRGGDNPMNLYGVSPIEMIREGIVNID